MSDEKERGRGSASNTSNPERQRKIERLKRERRQHRKRKAMIFRITALGVLILILAGCIFGINASIKKSKQKKQDAIVQEQQKIQEEEEKKLQKQDVLKQAEKVAKGYDYDKAIELLKATEKSESDAEISKQISEYENLKTKLVEADVETIPHVFFHILVADPSITWNLTDADEYKIADYNQVMTTIDEFKAMMQQMYDNGYVLVKIHDLVEETTDKDGNTIFTKGKIMLPEGKKPFVMSQDDVCYYFYMTGDGYASKMVIGEDGRPTTEYVQADGTTVTGSYDLVPCLNDFIDEHPDFSYKGAKQFWHLPVIMVF